MRVRHKIKYLKLIFQNYQVCGRETACAGDAKTRACYLEFLDYKNNEQNECISNQPTPSVHSAECQLLHNFNPSLQNSTVHLFSKFQYLITCYPKYSTKHGQGWCSTRRSGIFENKVPGTNSGWGFCSTDESQENCNTRIREVNDEALAHKMVVLDNKH